jgi:hypothetical protein
MPWYGAYTIAGLTVCVHDDGSFRVLGRGLFIQDNVI